MNCLIVDDEPLAQDVIEHYIAKTDFLQLTGKCNTALQAFSMLNKEKIDLMFLDIQMPEINGLELLKTLKHPPKVILTTAYTEYALDGYELDVVDYLLKPISFERFLKAVNKLAAHTNTEAAITNTKATNDSSKEIFVKSDGKYIRIDPADILYIEGLKNYLVIYTTQKKVIVHSTMKNIEDELNPFRHFIRVHKSYIINRHFILEIEGNMIKLGNAVVPVGGSYKDELMRLVGIL